MTSEELIYVADKTARMSPILDMFGWPYKGVPGQLPCPFHKAGQETRFSARVYDNGLFCYTCATQYSASQLYAALARISREKAAEKILAKWPPSPELQKEILKSYGKPYEKPVPQMLWDSAREDLLSYRHKVPLDLYRKWSERVEKLGPMLAADDEDQQKFRLRAFKAQMRQNLTLG